MQEDSRSNSETNDSNDSFAELRDLLADLTTGELTDEQNARLQQLVIQDEKACEFYLQYMFLYGTIHQEYCDHDRLRMPFIPSVDDPDLLNQSCLSVPNASIFPLLEIEKELFSSFNGNCSPDSLDGSASGTDDHPENPTLLFSTFTFLSNPIPLTIITICVLMLPVAMMIWNLSMEVPSVPPTCMVPGQVVKTVACTWDEKYGVGLRAGDLLVGNQEYHLKEGVLQLDLISGVQTIIQGPAVFCPRSSMLVELTEGRLSAKVSPEGKNFTVMAAGLKVIDLGTEFGVAVDRSAEVELHVFKGCVDVMADRWKQDGNTRPLELHAGEATRVDRLTGKVKKMPANESQFIREFSTESGLNLVITNPSFEQPKVANHPGSSKLYGNLHDVEVPGWQFTKSGQDFYWVYLQQAPYLADPKGTNKKVQKCILDAFDGRQMLGIRLGKVTEAWAFQTIGTIRMGDIGKTLLVSTNVVARKPTSPNATPFGATATAIVAFTCGTTEEDPGELLGLPGVATGVQTDQPSQHIVAELTITPQMIGKKLMVRLSMRDQGTLYRSDNLQGDFDPVNQYYFDVVDLKLRQIEK